MSNLSQSQKPTPNAHIKNDYGWLSPAGNFTPCNRNEHELAAELIIIDRKWSDEYWDVASKPEIFGHMTSSDFLWKCKNFVLIHQPDKSQPVQINYKDCITSFQTEFIYDYFVERNDIERANIYA